MDSDAIARKDIRLVTHDGGPVLRYLTDGILVHRVPDCSVFHRSTLPNPPPADVDAAVRLFHPNDAVEAPTFLPGEYYPRVWRGAGSPKPFRRQPPETRSAAHQEAWLSAGVAARSLLERAAAIFAVVEPSRDNAGTFGHELRLLLILACTEVEAAWRGVLRANEYAAPNGKREDRWNTSDYIRLLPIMRLNEWAIRLDEYPGYPELRPFEHWSQEAPTRSLEWYAHYNSAKHDREGHLDVATLGVVIEALAALTVLLCAQFGPTAFSNHGIPRTTAMSLSQRPTWLPTEQYFMPHPSDPEEWRWRPRPFFACGDGE